jgi:hypothetical protein
VEEVDRERIQAYLAASISPVMAPFVNPELYKHLEALGYVNSAPEQEEK